VFPSKLEIRPGGFSFVSIYVVKVRLITIAEGLSEFLQRIWLLGLRGERIAAGDLSSPMVDVEGKVYDLSA